MITVNAIVREERFNICKKCKHYDNNFKRCRLCSCIMPAKTWIANTQCPEGKWGKYNDESSITDSES